MTDPTPHPRTRGNRLIFLLTEDKWFITHRLTLATLARAEGFDTSVATRVTKYRDDIEKLGFPVHAIEMSRGGLHPLEETRTFAQILRLYRHVQPALVHHIGLKNILYGTAAAKLARVPSVVNTFAGLGFVFTSDTAKARFIRFIIRPLLRLLFAGPRVRVIFQNPDDLAKLTGAGIVRTQQSALIRSSGVNLSQYTVIPEPPEPVTVTLAGRLLWPKGVGVLADAGRRLRSTGAGVRISLAGAPDPQNPGSVSEAQLLEWQDAGLLDWLGYQEDMQSVWAATHIAALPSFYGEGVPKVLLEAAACGRPLIATDAPGCREIVVDGYNGILVPVNDSEALADAILRLASDPELRRRFGDNGRKLVEEHFSDQMIARQTVDVYRQASAARPGAVQ